VVVLGCCALRVYDTCFRSVHGFRTPSLFSDEFKEARINDCWKPFCPELSACKAVGTNTGNALDALCTTVIYRTRTAYTAVDAPLLITACREIDVTWHISHFRVVLVLPNQKVCICCLKLPHWSVYSRSM